MKKIGIVAHRTSSDAFGLTTPYIQYFNKFGSVHPILPSNEVFDYDLVVLPGGPDLSPATFGGVPSLFNSTICPFREYFYKQNLPLYIAKGTPIFGICLGMQQLNVHFGGRLTQHIAAPYSDTRDKLVEKLIFTERGNILKNSFQNCPKEIKINSLHHQGILEGDLARSLINIAYSTEGKNVEVLMHQSLPIAGVQYHPEEIEDWLSANIINALLKK